jgi:Spy/CpxP family protein refolding chaperone
VICDRLGFFSLWNSFCRRCVFLDESEFKRDQFRFFTIKSRILTKGAISRMKIKISLVLVTVLMVAVAVAAQRPGERGPLGMLKFALTEAGATALTTEQETKLTALITAFREGQPKGPDETLKAAHEAYAAAILAGDLSAAETQAAALAAQTTTHATSRLQAEAKFKIDVLAVLREGGQLDALKQKFGDARVVGMLSALAGPGRFGPGGPGRGPGHAGPGAFPGGPRPPGFKN